MRLLLIILSVMTWTVESKNTVSGSGECPNDMKVTYANTYNKGQVRANDTATLTLSNLGGITLEKIEMAMRSNNNAGAGSVTVFLNDKKASSTTITYKEVGDAVQVFTGAEQNVQSLCVQLTGSENSLYVDSYTITYTQAPPHTVTLMNGTTVYGTLTETQGNEGVILPALPDSAEWHFAGWSETEFYAQYTAPELIEAEAKYYPHDDLTLWAVYVNRPLAEMVYVSELESGRYIYFNATTNQAVGGAPEGGILRCDDADVTKTNQWYDITFNASLDSATIQHVESGAYIGYNKSAKIEEKKSVWNVLHNDTQTVFYSTISGKTYVLFPNLLDATSGVYYAGLIQTPNIASSPTVLMVAQEAGKPVYTCHPEGGQAVIELPVDHQREYRIPFGTFELLIRNGNKYLLQR